MQCPSCAAPASEGQSHCARCHASLTALAGAYAAPNLSTEKTMQLDASMWTAPASPEEPGESTQWWSPAMDEPIPAPPRAIAPPPAPVVPDDWFAAPITPSPSSPGLGESTGHFTPAFDDSQPMQQPPPHPAAPADSWSSEHSALSDANWPVVNPAEPFAASWQEPQEPPPSPFASAPWPSAEPQLEPWHAGPANGTPQPSQEPWQANGLARQPAPAQESWQATQHLAPQQVEQDIWQGANGVSAASPSPAPVREPWQAEIGHNGLAQGPGAAPWAPGEVNGGGPQQAWQAAQAAEQRPPEDSWQQWSAREERPLWDPNGPMPTTTSHRAAPTGGRNNKPLVIGVAVLVALAVVAVLMVSLTGGDDDKDKKAPTVTSAANPNGGKEQQPKPVDAASKAQAVKVNALLNSSTRSRQLLGGAIVKAARCGRLPQAISTMQQVAQQRQAQAQQAQALDYSKLTNGAALQRTLVKSMQLSLSVDQAYLQWAQSHQGCKGKTPTNDASYKQGATLSNQASRAKRQFLSGWNKTAPLFGLKKRSNF